MILEEQSERAAPGDVPTWLCPSRPCPDPPHAQIGLSAHQLIAANSASTNPRAERPARSRLRQRPVNSTPLKASVEPHPSPVGRKGLEEGGGDRFSPAPDTNWPLGRGLVHEVSMAMSWRARESDERSPRAGPVCLGASLQGAEGRGMVARDITKWVHPTRSSPQRVPGFRSVRSGAGSMIRH